MIPVGLSYSDDRDAYMETIPDMLGMVPDSTVEIAAADPGQHRRKAKSSNSMFGPILGFIAGVVMTAFGFAVNQALGDSHATPSVTATPLPSPKPRPTRTIHQRGPVVRERVTVHDRVTVVRRTPGPTVTVTHTPTPLPATT